MAILVLLSNSTQNDCKNSSLSTKFKKFITKLPRRISSAGSDKKVNPSCLVGFQQQLAAKGISRRAVQLVTNARRKGTYSNYQSARISGLAGVINRKLIDFDIF